MIDLNERKIMKNKIELKLTEREIEIILFLHNKNLKMSMIYKLIWKQKKN